MGYHTAVYNAAAAAAGATNVDFTAAVDAILTQRNGHYTFTIPFRLGKACPVGVSITRGRFVSPTWNAVGETCIFTANRAATVPSNPQYDDWMPMPPPVPLNEEFQVQLSNNLGAATEVESVILQLLANDWSPQLTPGQLPIIVRATFTQTPTANAWSALQALTLSQGLRNGVYSVIGCVVQGTNALAYRIVFPTQRMYAGKPIRPGGPVQNAVGDVLGMQRHPWVFDMGEMGRFHTFELPQIELFGLTAGAITYQVFLFCTYLGTDIGLLTNWAAGGSPQSTM